MGYYTRFSLESVDADTLNSGFKKSEVMEALQDLDENEVIASNLSCGDVKWYDYEEDMKAFSLKFPNVIITITGCGEDEPDYWIHKFLNGKGIWKRAELTYSAIELSEFESV